MKVSRPNDRTNAKVRQVVRHHQKVNRQNLYGLYVSLVGMSDRFSKGQLKWPQRNKEHSAAGRNQGKVTTDFTDNKDRFPIRDIRAIHGQKFSPF
jgi:hypothetical protein